MRLKPHAISVAVVCLALLLAVYASVLLRAPTIVKQVKARGELRIATRMDPTTFFYGVDEAEGPEHDLASAFAQQLNVTPTFLVADSTEDIETLLINGDADLAAAGLPWAYQHSQLLTTSSYLPFTPVLVARRGARLPSDDLTISVSANSGHEALLTQLDTQDVDINVLEVDALEVLYLLNQKDIEFVLMDNRVFQMHRHFLPELVVVSRLPPVPGWVWAMRAHQDNTLHVEAETFLKKQAKNGTLNTIQQRYFSRQYEFDYVGSHAYLRHIDERLPTYLSWFKQAGQKHDVDWRLLAAIGYQESHWMPRATSPTGVRGLMMLTNITAAQVGVTDRLDPKQSIEGGAKYVSILRKKIPARIQEPDRTWMTLAAYNVGFGHLEDARVLTERAGFDPDRWEHVRKHLPLLARKQYYATVKRGYARGWEPVNYIDNIQKYYDVLKWHLPSLGETFIANARY